MFYFELKENEGSGAPTGGYVGSETCETKSSKSPADYMDKFIALKVFTLSSLNLKCLKTLVFIIHLRSEDCFEKPSALQGFKIIFHIFVGDTIYKRCFVFSSRTVKEQELGKVKNLKLFYLTKKSTVMVRNSCLNCLTVW